MVGKEERAVLFIEDSIAFLITEYIRCYKWLNSKELRGSYVKITTSFFVLYAYNQVTPEIKHHTAAKYSRKNIPNSEGTLTK